MPAIYQSAGPVTAVNTMKQTRLFQAIFKYHPESEAEAIIRMQKIMAGPKIGQLESSRALGAELTARYFDADVLNASDISIHRVLQSALNITVGLKGKPETCVGMYLATPGTRVEDVPQNLTNEQLEAKADVIETAFVAPSPSAKSITIDQIVVLLRAAYKRNNFDVNELSSLGELGTLPPTKACAIIERFLSALTSMSNADASTVFKGLIIAGK